jgi:hypothetical protein
MGFSLEGIINEWSFWAIGGTALGLLFAVQGINYLTFFKAHEAFKVAVNKNLTRF